MCLQHQGEESGPQQQSGVSGKEGGGFAGQTGFSGESAPAGREQAKEPAGPGPGPHTHTAERGTHTEWDLRKIKIKHRKRQVRNNRTNGRDEK